MLVLTRQRDETIIIGDNIEITVVDIRGEKVRLGINAPKTIPVHRKEIWEQIRRENSQAAKLKPDDIAGIPPGPPPPAPNPFPRLADPALGNTDDPFMLAAIDEAKLGLSEGGLPIGAVLVRSETIIGRGHNRRVQRGDPMAHAEIDCLTNAGRQKTYHDTVLYSTLMPCHLCSGAVVQFGIPRVVVGEAANFPGAPDFLRANGIVVTNLNDARCIEFMSRFVREHPDLWNEDIGK